MPIRITCPSCSASLSLKDEAAGRSVKCPKCGSIIPPAPAEPPPPPPPAFEEVEDEPAPPPKGGGKISGRPTTRPKDEDEEDDRPRKKRRDEEEEEAPRGKAKRGADRDEEGDDRPAKKRRDDEEDGDDGPPRGKKPGKKSNAGLIIGIIAGTLLLCCGGVAGGVYYFMKKVKEGAEEFVDNLKEKNDKVTSANYQKLTPLMTKAEVEAVLGVGKPARLWDLNTAYEADTPANNARKIELAPKMDQGRLLMWRNKDDYLFVAFHDKPESGGKLQMKEFVPKGGAAEHSGDADDARFAKANGLTKKDDSGPPKKVDPNAPKPLKPTANDKTGAVTSITAADLIEDCKDDPADADKQYQGKRLLVTEAVVESWESDHIAQLKAKGGPQPKSIRVIFLDEQQAQIAKYKVGDTIKFRGSYISGAGPAVQFTRGWIVP